MKLYYSKGACSLAIRILINELKLKAEFEAVDLKTHKTETGLDYYKINPKGSVPVIRIDNQLILTENAIIHVYLADQNKATQLLPAIGDFNRYRTLEWLNFVTTELHKGFSPLFNPIIPEEVKDQVFRPNLKKKFSLINNHLEHNANLMGPTYSLPDGYLFVMLFWATKHKLDLNEYANLMRYYNTLKIRPSIQQSLNEEGLV